MEVSYPQVYEFNCRVLRSKKNLGEENEEEIKTYFLTVNGMSCSS